MARLIVNACDAEFSVQKVPRCFQVTSIEWPGMPVYVADVHERNWGPANIEPSGCYQVEVAIDKKDKEAQKFYPGMRYILGLKVRTFAKGTITVVDRGQTVLQVTSLDE